MKVVSKAEFERVTGVKFTIHCGKLEGIPSLSTWYLSNPYCIARMAIHEAICHKCYVTDTAHHYGKVFVEKFKRNHNILTETILDVVPDLSRCKAKYYRLESFGDICTLVQIINYVNIVKANPSKTFTLFTKNAFLLSWAFNEKQIVKPSNLIIVYSSHMINESQSAIFRDPLYWFIDKVFTVYTEDYIKEHDIDINCGARSCLSCLKCYSKYSSSILREKLK